MMISRTAWTGRRSCRVRTKVDLLLEGVGLESFGDTCGAIGQRFGHRRDAGRAVAVDSPRMA